MRIRNFFFATMFLTAACGGGTTEPNDNGNGNGNGNGTITERAVSVAVNPSSMQLQPNERSSLNAIVLDKNGFPINRTVTWRSSNTSVASVSSNGEVVGIALGDVTITATADGVQGAASVAVRSVPPVATVTVTNQLIYPVTVEFGGISQGSVPAQGSRQFANVPAGALTIDWDLVRPTLSGTPLGEAMGGIFSVILTAGTPRTFTIDNQVGLTTYFAPLVTNLSSQPLLMVVNYGLQSELRCNCVAPVASTRVQFGYYRLFSNSNMTVFRNGSGYTGTYRYFDSFSGFVTSGSGTREFSFSTAP